MVTLVELAGLAAGALQGHLSGLLSLGLRQQRKSYHLLRKSLSDVRILLTFSLILT